MKYYSASTLLVQAGQPSGEGKRIAMRTNGTLTWLLGDHITAKVAGMLARIHGPGR